MTDHDGVLILAGPTASGKSELAIELAGRFDAEIINADSRQIYRGIAIGTAAPTADQLALVPHHLVGFVDPAERYSAARFSSDASDIVASIQARGKRAIVVGGTGFYLRALAGQIALAPEPNPSVRDRLAREAKLHEPGFLHQWLAVRDFKRASELHPSDSYRVIRALEIVLSSSDRGVSTQPVKTLASQQIPFLKVFLRLPNDELDARIERRTDAMLEGGLLEEAERIGTSAVAANAVGFPQALAYLAGWCTRAELRALLIRATRRYAKRQQTWFRAEPQTLWLERDLIARAAQEKLGWA